MPKYEPEFMKNAAEAMIFEAAVGDEVFIFSWQEYKDAMEDLTVPLVTQGEEIDILAWLRADNNNRISAYITVHDWRKRKHQK